MKSLKFYKILSITLLILNIVTISIFFFHRPPGPPPPGEARLANDIGLTGKAKKKVDALEIQHHKDKRALIRTNFKLQKKLYNSLTDDEASKETLNEIHENRAKIDEMTFQFFSKVATYCNKTQRQNLENMIEHRLHQITNVPGKPRKH